MESVVGSATIVPVDTESMDSSRTTLLPTLIDGPDPQVVDEPTPRFQLVGALGRGGVGEVYAANDQDIGRRVAIKRVRSDRKSRDAVLRFVQEVRTTGQLDHPNIVPIHDVGREDDGTVYFVMKYLDGESLESLIGRLRGGDAEALAYWTFERRVALFMQILHAIDFAHRRGVVHRDIKPANVMVGACGAVHVVDWGLAKRLGDADAKPSSVPTLVDTPEPSPVETQMNSLIGTPLYMAPEQARRERSDQRTDIWQLSVLFYELLTLSHFLDGRSTLDEILEGVQRQEIPHPSQVASPHQGPVPFELGHIVMRGLVRDRAQRIASVGELVAMLEARTNGDIRVECPVTLQKWFLHRTLQWIDRHPALAMGGFAVGLLGAIAFGLLSFGALATGVVLSVL